MNANDLEVLIDVADPQADALLADAESDPDALEAGFAAISDGLFDDAQWAADDARYRTELFTSDVNALRLH
jgi:hypothetical protein